MACALGRACDRNEWQEVARAPGEREQNTHREIQAETSCRASGRMKAAPDVENRQRAPFFR
jgi:hypothetical protein